MKIFMTFSALILCFVIHGVLTGRLPPPTTAVLDKCFENFYSYNCSEDFEKVISTVSNKWCCIKFIYNEKNDDEVLQNNVMTSSGNGNENMTTNIMISSEAYDDSMTTDDDVSTDTKLDSIEKYQNPVSDETDSINMNEAIDDSSLSNIENSIDSQLNNAMDDDAESVQQAGENFENIESNLDANEIENELSDTRLENQDEVQALLERDDEIEDLSDDGIKLVPKLFDEDKSIDIPHDNDSKEEADYNEEYDLDPSEKIYPDTDVDSAVPEYITDKTKLGSETLEDNKDNATKYLEGVANSKDRLKVDSVDIDNPTRTKELIEKTSNTILKVKDPEEEDLPTLNEESTDIKVNSDKLSLQNENLNNLDSDLDINNQLDDVRDDSNSAVLKSFNLTDSNQQDENSADEDYLDDNFIINADKNSIQASKDDLKIGTDGDENQIDESSEALNQNVNELSDEVGEKPTEVQNSLDIDKISTLIPTLTTKSIFLPAPKRRPKLNGLKKIKPNRPSSILKTPENSFKKQLTNTLTQRNQRLNSKRKQPNFNLNASKDTLQLNSGQSGISPETHSSSNDDDSNEIQEQEGIMGHDNIMNANSPEINHDDDDAANESSLNNLKSIISNNENVNSNTKEDTEEEKSRQQQISKLSKQSPTSDSNDSLQLDNLVENESNQLEDSMTEKVKNDNAELLDRQRGEENLQQDDNQVDDNKESINDQIVDGVTTAGAFTRDKAGVKRRPVIINKQGQVVDRKPVGNAKKSNVQNSES